MNREERVQIQLGMTFKQQPADHARVKAYLERGYRVVHVQRVTDHEALVTLAPPRGELT